LQQTRVDQGLQYYLKFKSAFPTIKHLAQAEEIEVLNLWKGLGYYSRARNLHATAKFIVDYHQGNFPSSYEEIIKLKGIGSYTAAAISSFAFGEPKAVLDGNVFRVLSRLFHIETPIDSGIGKREFQNLADELISSEVPNIYNQAIMEFGAIMCTPNNPSCSDCPFHQECLSLKNGTISERPVKKGKTKIRSRYFHYFNFNNGKETIIKKRTEKDI
jgi:A/G-specific adenine glycosylase